LRRGDRVKCLVCGVITDCGPKGLAYATPSDAAARTSEMELKCGYKLGSRGEKTRGDKQETLSREP
jgi:hypothetical protein